MAKNKIPAGKCLLFRLFYDSVYGLDFIPFLIKKFDLLF